MNRVLVDTNILIELLNGDERALHYLAELGHCACSTITLYEVFAGLTPQREPQRQTARELFNYFDLIPVDATIAEKAAAFTLEYGKGKAPDHMIAATAHLGGYDLATHNRRDFPMITTIDPYPVKRPPHS